MKPASEEVLFALPLEKPAEHRQAFLNAVCQGDSSLRQRLEALLAASEKSGRNRTHRPLEHGQAKRVGRLWRHYVYVLFLTESKPMVQSTHGQKELP